jgi:hypothetical protein
MKARRGGGEMLRLNITDLLRLMEEIRSKQRDQHDRLAEVERKLEEREREGGGTRV